MKKSCSGFKKKLSCKSEQNDKLAIDKDDFSKSKVIINRKRYDYKADVEKFEKKHGRVKYTKKGLSVLKKAGIHIKDNVALSESEQKIKDKESLKQSKKTVQKLFKMEV